MAPAPHASASFALAWCRASAAWALWVTIAIVGVSLVQPGEARAYEEQIALNIDAGYVYAQHGLPTHGVGVGVGAGIGLGDTFTLVLRGGYAAHPGSTPGHVLSATAEVLYIVDILTWVPFFGIGTDGHLILRDGQVRGNFEVHGVLGLDYLHSRTLAIGLDVRVGYLPFEPTAGVLHGLHAQAGLRVSYLFSRW
ncbi:MAG: hypothetical protein R3B40_14520 [Polyangiales bacterium]|nr:hypothetical protein [Myxococcales bacterium]MCB9659268.1 hypothetical protein [Sandaracinaceae bacterium]